MLSLFAIWENTKVVAFILAYLQHRQKLAHCESFWFNPGFIVKEVKDWRLIIWAEKADELSPNPGFTMQELFSLALVSPINKNNNGP